MKARVSVALQLLLCGLVLCTAALGWAVAEADFGSANPFLSAGGDGDSEGADDEAAAELEMRSERFRLEREATRTASATQTATEVVAHFPSILLVETDSNANVATATTATTAATTTVAAAAATTAATPTTTAPALAAAAAAPAVPAATAAAPAAAPALVEADSKPKPSDKAPFMPGYDENAPEPVHATAAVPLPPPAPVMSLDTLKMVAEHPPLPPAAAAKADAATTDVADVTEDEAADLLEQVSAVIAGDIKARRSPSAGAAAHRFRALSAKQQSRRAAAAKAPGYGQPGVRDRHSHGRGHGRRHHKRAARKHHRSHRSRRHTKRAERDEQEMPRFAVKTERDLVREARERAAALLGTPAVDAAATAASTEAEAEVDGANTAEAVRAKRNQYARHSRAMEEDLHRFMSAHHENAAAADEQAATGADAEADTEHHDEEAAEHEEGVELSAEEQAQAEADAEAEAAAELEAEAAAEAEAKIKAAADAAAKAKAEVAAKAAAEAAAKLAADKAVMGARFSQQRLGLKSRQRQRLRVGLNAAPGYGPPLHAPPDTHGSPPVMSSTVDLPLNRPPTPNYFYPPTANPPPAAIQTPRLPSLNPNPAAFAPQFPNADAYRSHQMNPYGQFQRVAPPMQREPAASLYPPYSSVPNFEPAAPRAGLDIEMPEPAGGAPSLVEWAAAVHRNTHYDANRAQQQQQPGDRPIAQFAGFSAPMAQAPAGF